MEDLGGGLKNNNDISPKNDCHKIGLALSGGGFRASIFHIGTMAALAEAGILHKFNMISTVSGGSIIGAYYYLKVKRLLEGSRGDGMQPSKEAYVKIMQEIARDFVRVTQKNIVMQIFTNPWTAAHIVCSEEYTRSDRLAELLDKFFYKPVSGVDAIRLKDIHINYSWESEYKIPILSINSTTLNTGHPWQFTGAWMGEPDLNYAKKKDTVPFLPRLRFDGIYQDDKAKQIPADKCRKVAEWQLKKMRQIKLSHAVGSSANVPGLFAPFPIHDLFKGEGNQEMVVQLVDGGVYDNVGLYALWDNNCDYMFVSDGAKPFAMDLIPNTESVKVLSKFFLITLCHDRFNEFACLEDAKRQNQIAGYSATIIEDKIPEDTLGILNKVKKIRTDLDSFNDLESAALMYQAYVLTKQQINNNPDYFKTIGADLNASVDWDFLKIKEYLGDKDKLQILSDQLDISSMRFFKGWKILPWVAKGVLGALGLSLVALAFLLLQMIGIQALAWLALVLLLLMQTEKVIHYLRRTALFRRLRVTIVGDIIKAIARSCLTVMVAPISLGLIIYLKTLGRYYVEKGKMK